MSDTPNLAQIAADLAAAHARIADLEEQIRAAPSVDSEGIAARDAQIATLRQQNGDLQHAAQQNAAAIEVADNAARIATDRADKADADRAALAAKFDALHGEVEPGSGISRCAGYVTEDHTHHASLQAAHFHLVGKDADAVMQKARAGQLVPKDVADRLAAGLAQISS